MLSACFTKRSKKPSSRGKNRCKSPGMLCDSPLKSLGEARGTIEEGVAVGKPGDTAQGMGSSRKKRAFPFAAGRPFRIEVVGELENLVHAAHAAGTRCARGCCLGLFFDFSDECFCREH